MRLRSLALAGLASTASGRKLRPRQEPSGYSANATEPSPTIAPVAYSTATLVVDASTASLPPSYDSGSTETTGVIVAPVPYSSPEAVPPSSYDTTTITTALEYTMGPAVVTAVSPPPYTSQKYSFASPPVGPHIASSGSAPADYTPPSGYSYAPPSSSGYSPPSGYSSPSGYSTPATTVTSTNTYVVTGVPRPHRPSGYLYPSGNATDETCSGATLNILDASLDWWYTKTLYHAVSTVSILYNRNDSSTGWTVLPATTTFNVQSALSAPDCTSTPAYTSLSTTRYAVDCTSPQSPVAAETTIITQTAYRSPNATSGNGTVPQLVVTPPPASISVTDAAQTPYSSGTPFVYFSKYEIVSKSLDTHGNSTYRCAEATQTFTMAEAFSFEYTGGDVNGSLLVNEGVMGDVSPSLLDLVGQDTAVAGSWVAEPTVVLLMQEVFVAQAALAESMSIIQPTASFLETPNPTKPSYVTLAPTGNGGRPTFVPAPVIEQTAPELDVPSRTGDDNRPTGMAAGQTQGGSNNGGSSNNSGGSNNGGSNNDGQGNGGGNAPDRPNFSTHSVVAFIAHVAQSEVTLEVPAAATQNIITTEYQGGTVTATRLAAMDGSQGGGFQNLVDAINSVANRPPAPTNALEVLSQAEQTFQSGGNPTAAAIMNGIGGSAQQGNPPGRSPITVGGAVLTPDAQGNFQLSGGQTLTPGGVAVVAGTTLSFDAGASAVVVNGVTEKLDSVAQATDGAGSNGGSGSNGASPITVGGAIITGDAQGHYNVGAGQTLTPGGIAVVSGTTLSLDAAGTALVVNGVTQTLDTYSRATGGAGGSNSDSVSGSPGPNIPLIVAPGRSAAVTPNAATEYSIAPGATLTPGGQVVVSGTTLSLDRAGTALVVDGVTRNLAATSGAAIITPNAASQYVIAPGATLTPGGQVVVDGTTMSLDRSGTALVVDGTTRTINSPAGAITAPAALAAASEDLTKAPVLTIAGSTYYAINDGTTYAIDGQTLTMGEQETVTIGGTVYQVSLAPSATRLVVGTENAEGRLTAASTQTLFPEQGAGSRPSATGGSGSGSQSGSGATPDQQVGNGAVSALPWSGAAFAVGSLMLAVWL